MVSRGHGRKCPRTPAAARSRRAAKPLRIGHAITRTGPAVNLGPQPAEEPREVIPEVDVEVKIGVQHAARELVLDSPQSTDEITKAVSASLSGESRILSLTDESGRRVVVPADKLAYVEIGEPETRRVGFGAM
jgi:hypothetical protein